MPAKPSRDWPRIRKLALGLGLPDVVEATAYGAPALKAHGKLWVWCSPTEGSLVFKVGIDERDMLIDVDPACFYITPHYRNSAMVLAREGKLDLAWARNNLTRVWRELAPKRVLKAHDAQTATKSSRR
jgi:hypothetical protein